MPTNRYKRTRDDHSMERAEDYVELIDGLIREHGEARVVEMARKLAVTTVAVSNMVQRLQRDGYVTAERYRSVFLTEQGHQLAAATRARHDLVRDFLRAIGVPPTVAETDAEGIHHHVSQETLAAMRMFLDKAQ